MKQLSSAQVRQMWLDFWATKGHSAVSYTHLDVYKRQVPKEFRETFIEQLKDARDSAKDSSESPVDQDSDDEDSDSDE